VIGCDAIWIADAHRDGKHFIVHADEKLMAFGGTGSCVSPDSGSRHCIAAIG